RLLLAAQMDQIAPIFVKHDGRAASQKGVPCPLFSAFDTLQEVRGRAVVDLGKRGHRCFIVSQNLSIEGNEVPFSSVTAKPFEAKCIDWLLHGLFPYSYSWPTISFCPTSIMSSGSLFHFRKVSTFTP